MCEYREACKAPRTRRVLKMMALPPRGLQWFAWRNDWERGWVTQELGPDGEAISLEIRHTWLEVD